MKTKEEILYPYYHSKDEDGNISTGEAVYVEDALKAMEEYASQSEGVCEWKRDKETTKWYSSCAITPGWSNLLVIDIMEYCPMCGKPIKRKE